MTTVIEQARGRWPAILSMLGLDDRFLRNRHMPCPSCGGRDRYRFHDDRGNGNFFCSHCGPGDGMDLLMRVNNWTFKQAAEQVETIVGKVPVIEKPRTTPDPREYLRAVQKMAQPIEGTPVEKYLHRRGIEKTDANLFYAERMAYYDDGRKLGEYHAMLGKVVGPQGEPVTWHVTYLDQFGKKAEVPSPKKILTPARKLNGDAIWLDKPSQTIVVCEGIETGMAIREHTSNPVLSLLNTSNMEKFVPSAVVGQVLIFADNDVTYAGHKAAYSLAYKLKTSHISVQVFMPPEVGDFLDHYNAKKKTGIAA